MALADLIVQAESGGNANARNPRSSAAGLGQFIDSTWISMLQRHRPDLVQGRSKEELLSLKSDPDLSRAMTEAYAADNAGVLSKSGLPVTPGTQYLAHFAGPQGAVGVLSADPSLPVGSVLGEAAVRANPFLAKMTAGDLQAWADRKMGGGSSQPSPQAAPPQAYAGLGVASDTQQAPFSLAPAAPSAPQAYSPYMPDIPDIPPPMPLILPKRKPAPRGGFFHARG